MKMRRNPALKSEQRQALFYRLAKRRDFQACDKRGTDGIKAPKQRGRVEITGRVR
jgi:hypothetical protein